MIHENSRTERSFRGAWMEYLDDIYDGGGWDIPTLVAYMDLDRDEFVFRSGPRWFFEGRRTAMFRNWVPVKSWHLDDVDHTLDIQKIMEDHLDSMVNEAEEYWELTVEEGAL